MDSVPLSMANFKHLLSLKLVDSRRKSGTTKISKAADCRVMRLIPARGKNAAHV